MFRGRQKCSLMEKTVIADRVFQHYGSRWPHSSIEHKQCSNGPERFFLKNSTRSPHYFTLPPQSVTYRTWSFVGGHFAFWFCLILLQQSQKVLGNLVTRDVIQTLSSKNTSLSYVNTLLHQNLPPHSSKVERRSPTQVCMYSSLSICFTRMTDV